MLDVYIEPSMGGGHYVHPVWAGRPAARVLHRPWFVALVPPSRGEPRPGGRVLGAKRLQGIGLRYDPDTMTYRVDPLLRVYMVETGSAGEVPRAAGELSSKMGLPVGQYNIKYPARVALDLSRQGWGILGAPTPAAFLPNAEMVAVMEEVLEKIAGLKVAVFDIEVLPRGEGFPRLGDPVLSIQYAVVDLGDPGFWEERWPRENVRVLWARELSREESARLAEEFWRDIERSRAVILLGYNSTAFDIPYLKAVRGLRGGWSAEGVWLVKRSPGRGLELALPHIDLFILRKNMGGALGLRSHSAYALDDVAAEVARKTPAWSWLKNSRLIEAEKRLSHSRLRVYWEKRDPLLEDYVVADVYLTALLARVWLYPLLLLAVLTGMPPSLLQELNVGQVAEYLAVELLNRLGFYPELRSRQLDYSRTTRRVDTPGGWVYSLGKVYALTYGWFGGPEERVVELDFAQLYPSFMVAYTSDPTSLYKASHAQGTRIASERRVEVMLGRRVKKSSTEVEPVSVEELVPGYGPISWLVYKLYTARWETKKLKKRAKSEGRPELAAPDQAVKILNNSFYGGFSKRRGNLVNEALSAMVFWGTQRMLYEVVGYIDSGGAGPARVLYGDTDSTYVLTPRSVDPEEFADTVNRWIRRRYGKFFVMEKEGEYDSMIIPRLKDEDAPSAKSYITVAGGRPAKLKGELFKLPLPLAVRERLEDFYAEIVRRRPSSLRDLLSIIGSFLDGSPPVKWFIRKSISSFVSDEDPRLLKRLNKEFHYAALYAAAAEDSPGTQVVRGTAVTALGTVSGWGSAVIAVDARVLSATQRAVVVHYLPGSSPRDFYVYMGEEGDRVIVHKVFVESLKVVAEGSDERDRFETGYRMSVRFRVYRLSPGQLKPLVLQSVRRTSASILAAKLLPALSRRLSLGDLAGLQSPVELGSSRRGVGALPATGTPP